MHSGDNAKAPLTPALVFEMLQAHQRTAALKAAIDLDVFRAVGEGPGDVASIARHCSASERGIRILCDFLTINGVLVKEDGRYRHTPTSAAFLDPRSPASLASIAQFLSNPGHARALRPSGGNRARPAAPILPGDGSVEPENPIWVQFAETMAPMMAPMVGPLGAVVLDGHAGPMRVLDIAAGHGLFGIEIAKQNPQARVTGLDWAPVLRVALDNARRPVFRTATTCCPAAPSRSISAGLMTPCCSPISSTTSISRPALALLKKVHAALRPGGRAATLEFVPNEDRVSPPMPAAFSMTMLASTVAGDAYTLSELTTMYNQAGFGDVTAHPIPMSPHTVVMGRA